MELTDPAKLKAQKTYDAAADLFDARPLAFWGRYGERTVARLHLRPGETVLDIACGTGASALPAAVAVSPTGRVIGVDLAQNLLTLAREKAERRGLANVEFRQADMSALGYPDAAFGAVVCVFGVFFVKDMEGLVAELWRMVKPGGRLSVTTWGPRIFAPMYESGTRRCAACVPTWPRTSTRGIASRRRTPSADSSSLPASPTPR